VRKFLYATAALVAAVAVLIVLTMPRRRLALAGGGADGTIAGTLHVHTNRSDGRSGPDDVAAAAARAGLKFVVFTDHGDATRTPDPPAYRSGVLCVDGVEISTTGGHYVALDMPAAPYPLAGEPRDVVEDVHRLGGFGIAAHPDSPKPELRWTDWEAPIDGMELLNPDTAWRVWAHRANDPASVDKWSARRRIAFSLLGYPFRSPETIADILEPIAGESAVAQWTTLAARRRVVSVAGVDAHAMLALRGDPVDSGYSLPFPGYEATFRTVSIHVRPHQPFSGNAAADAAALMRAIRNGHLYTAVDGLATPASFELSAVGEGGTVLAGDEVPAGKPLTLHVRSNAPAAFTTTVWNGGGVFSGNHHESEFSVPAPATPGTYWVDVRSDGRPHATAWLRSNPIYVRGPEADAPARSDDRSAATVRAVVDRPGEPAWRIEHDQGSPGAIEIGDASGEVVYRFGLASGVPSGQYVALVHDLESDAAAADRFAFTVRSERAMRISVQLRGGEGVVDRWQRSVFVDTTNQQRIVSFDDCRPVGITHTPRAPRGHIRSIMLVVDTTNTKPGTSGRIVVSQAALMSR
jgi:hypothetical protein